MPRPLAFSLGGRTVTALTTKDYTFEQFAKLLSTPKVGQKDGSYYLRGGELKTPQRADENLVSAWLIILDGDSGFDPETGELTGAPPLDVVHQALADMNVTHHIHATHSARPAQGVHKYRAVIPVERLASPDELDACLEYLFERLHARGVTLVNATENKRWAQLWYLARVPTADDLPAFQCATHYGEWLAVAACVQWLARRVEQRRKEETLPSAPPVSRALQGHDSPISQFNDQHGVDWVRRELEARGYRFAYFDKRAMGGAGGHRYTRPNSSTGQPGVVVFTGARGHACVFSHHGGEDPLSGKTHDPFALFALFHHNGDLRAGARAIMPPEQSIVEKIRERDQGAAEGPVNELRRDQRLEDFASYPQESERQTKKPTRAIELVPWADLQDVSVRWLVRDIIPAQSLVALYGKPGSYKSFVALDLAARIAAGLQAFDRDVEQGAVVYIAGEGGAGLKRRRDAIVKRHGLPKDIPIFFLRAQLDLRSKPDDAIALLAAIRALGVKVSLIIIDTLARAFGGGNENSSEDMGAFIGIISALQEELACAALIVHHSGKDEARGMRGHSSLLGAVDAELEVTKLSPEGSEERIGQLTVTKQKDGEDGFKIMYRLETVHLSALDPDATSLAVVMMEEDEAKGLHIHAKAVGRPSSDNDALVWQAFEDTLAESPVKAVGRNIPRGQDCVRKGAWLATFMCQTFDKSDTAKEKAFYRAVKRFQTKGKIKVSGDFVWVSGL